MSKHKILVVEDDTNLLEMYKTLLTQTGYDVVPTNTGEAALDAYRENPDFSVVILDLILPGIHGEEVLEKIQKSNPSQHVIICTGSRLTKTFPGNVKILQKPFIAPVLLDMIEEAAK